MLNYSLAADAKAAKRLRGGRKQASARGKLKSNVEKHLDLKTVAYESLTYLLPCRTLEYIDALLSGVISRGTAFLF